MKIFNNDSLDCQINVDDYISQTKLSRGYIYILLDKAFPDFCKIGRTCDMAKRLQAYNSHKPYPSAYIYAISKEFVNVEEVEAKILKYMYSRTSPTTFRNEWFSIEHLSLLVNIIEKAEKHFKLVSE